MATPTSITVYEPNIILETGVLVIVDSIQPNYEFASVRQVFSGSIYAVDDPVAFSKDDAIWFTQSGKRFYVIDESKILFKVGEAEPEP